MELDAKEVQPGAVLQTDACLAWPSCQQQLPKLVGAARLELAWRQATTTGIGRTVDVLAKDVELGQRRLTNKSLTRMARWCSRCL